MVRSDKLGFRPCACTEFRPEAVVRRSEGVHPFESRTRSLDGACLRGGWARGRVVDRYACRDMRIRVRLASQAHHTTPVATDSPCCPITSHRAQEDLRGDQYSTLAVGGRVTHAVESRSRTADQFAIEFLAEFRQLVDGVAIVGDQDRQQNGDGAECCRCGPLGRSWSAWRSRRVRLRVEQA